MVSALALLAVSAAAQQPQDPSAPDPTAEAIALCTTWRLTGTSLELAMQIKAIALQRVERAKKLMEECKARPECSREERVNLEQDLREAVYHLARAEALAAGFEERRLNLRKQLEALRGADAVRNCDDGAR